MILSNIKYQVRIIKDVQAQFASIGQAVWYIIVSNIQFQKVAKRLKKYIKKDGDKMPTIIEEIVRVQRQESDAFIKIQQQRLSQLRRIEQRKQDGKKIQAGRIVKELQASGILDANGDLSKKYSD